MRAEGEGEFLQKDAKLAKGRGGICSISGFRIFIL